MRGVPRFVKDLLRQRRPRAFRATPGEAAELRAAIELRAAGPDSGAADPEFVERLRGRVAAERAGVEPGGGSRRRFVRATSVAAAAAALGVAADRVLGDQSGGSGDPVARATVVPDAGEWRPVVATKDLPEGGVRPFDLGTVVGFVERTGGEVRAVSGTCTHLGCKLTLDAPARRLDCPCHRAAFAVDGSVLHHRLPIPLPPLPRVLVRESGGVVQVFVPADQT
ncbi:Rieske (2Fe-2S) protein [Actinokineospora sp. NBRC 105648]|uniref:QcrA and Rieske domain-containing protein n=1 Tax=Actinokineospora sp. NBRC 105648 TaxID=3032206 RepID=UPI0024A03912|nr:Rieske (2Fe-2S) protein [Actinokineospora sp. NBRC 105648]GLZ38083.1 (2Fe-2S) ferredoxin [Actinokineospora sp. NBRC 105648]